MSSLPSEALPAATVTWRFAAPASLRDRSWRISMLSALRVAVGLLVVANLGRIPLLSTGDRVAPLFFNDLCVACIVGLSAINAAVARTFRADRLMMLALLFAAIGAYSAVLAIPRYGLSGWQLFISLAYLARWLMYFALYAVTINVVRARDVMVLWGTLEASILVFAAFGLFQSAFIPHFAQVVYPDSRVVTDFDEQGHRLVSTVLDPNLAGAMILLVFLVHLAQLAGGERIPAWKPLILFAALVATLSRSSFLGLMVGAVIVFSIRGISARMLRVFTVLGVLLLALAPKIIVFAASYNKFTIDASALSRVTAWLRALRIFADHPVLGIGFNTYAFVQERYGYLRLGSATYSVDGGLLFVAVMTGVVGLTLYVGMLVLVMRRCRSVWRSQHAPAEFRALSAGIAAATVAVCVHSIFVNSLLTAFVMEPLFILWALSFVMARATAAERLARIRSVGSVAR